MPSAPTTIERPETELDTDEVLDVPWNVTVFDDPVNLMRYVTMVLMRVFGHQRQRAETMMLAIHKKGKCIVWSGERERAELYVQQLHSHQLRATMARAE